MLILERLVGETVVIDGPVKVTVQKIRKGGRVRLSFEADKSVTIDRLEVHEAKQKERANER
jgi:carbon storage regulator CsrA